MSIHPVAAKSGTRYQVKLRRENGTQYSRHFRTLREAREYESREKADRSRGIWLDDRHAEITFSEMAKRWVESNQAKRHTSRKRDEGILNKHLLPVLGSRKLRTIRRADISTMVNSWSAQNLTPATIRRHVAVLSAIFNLAVAEDLLHKSPTMKVALPRINPSSGRALKPHESDILLRNIPRDYFALVFILLTTGIRWSEAVGLQIKHFSPMTTPPTLSIEQGLHETENGFVLEAPKSAASHRVIVLSERHVEVIVQYLQETGRTAANWDEPLFITHRGGRIISSNFRNRVWQQSVKAAGLEGLRIKDLRKTAATNLLQSGADAKTVTAVMGHEDIRTTLNHYAKTTPESLRLAAEALVRGVGIDGDVGGLRKAN